MSGEQWGEAVERALTPIPAEHRHLYHEALRAGLAEAERRELDLDALPFAAFHRALYRPMVELIVADTRRKVARDLSDYRNRTYLTSEAKRALWQAIRIASDDTARIIRAENVAIARGSGNGGTA